MHLLREIRAIVVALEQRIAADRDLADGACIEEFARIRHDANLIAGQQSSRRCERNGPGVAFLATGAMKCSPRKR